MDDMRELVCNRAAVLAIPIADPPPSTPGTRGIIQPKSTNRLHEMWVMAASGS